MYKYRKNSEELINFTKVFSDQITLKRFSIGIIGLFISLACFLAVLLVFFDSRDDLADAVEVGVPVSVSGYSIKSINGVQQNSLKMINNPNNLKSTNLHEGDVVEIENMDNELSSWKTLRATVVNNSLKATIQKNEVCYWECTPSSPDCYYADSRNPDGSYWAFQLCAHTSSGDAIGRAECQERGHDLCGPGCYDFMGFRDYCCVPGDSGCYNLKLQCVVTWIGYWVESDGIGYHHWSVTNDGYKLRAEYQRWLGEFKAPATGVAQMQKKSTWDWTETSPNYSLAGAKYYVYKTNNDALNRVNAVETITLNESGFGETKNILYAELTYYVRESNLPGEHGIGYKVNDDIGHVTIKPDQPSTVIWSEDKPVTYDVPIVQDLPLKLLKKDAQTMQEGVTEGSVASFADAHYSFEYRRGIYTNLGEFEAANLDKIWNWIIATDENGAVAISEEYRDKWISGDNFIEWDNKVVAPLGTYLITEVKAPDGYLINETKYLSIIEQDDSAPGGVKTMYYDQTNGKQLEQILDPHTGDRAVATLEQVVRGDYKFTKVNEDRDTLSGIPFKITSKTTGEWHIVVTDENGLIDTSNSHYKHSQNTNCNDTLYDADTGKITKEDSLTSNCGTWFGINKETGTLSVPDDTYCALPYDTYLIEEIPISINEKYLPFESRTFVIENDTYNIAGDTWVNAEPKSPLPHTGDLPFCIIGLSVLAVLCYITRRWVYYRKY